MEQDQHRREKLMPILSDLNTRYPIFNIHIFTAVNGRTYPTPDNHLYTPHFVWSTYAMKGCAMSHMALWEHIAKNNDIAVILEDDAIPDECFFQEFNDILLEMGDRDLFHLCAFWDRNDEMMCGAKRWNCPDVNSSSSFHYWINTAAYIITRKGADILHSLLHKKISYHIDMGISGVIHKKKIRSGCADSCRYFQIINEDGITHNTECLLPPWMYPSSNKNITNLLNTTCLSIMDIHFCIASIIFGLIMCSMPAPLLCLLVSTIVQRYQNRMIRLLLIQGISMCILPPFRIVWICFWMIILYISIYLFLFYTQGKFITE